jgi:hypothetical protein
MSIDLSRPEPGDMVLFCQRIATKAETDHRLGVKRRPTGVDLCYEFAPNGFRHGHKKLATGVYNGVRWSLEIAAIQPSNQPG